MANRNECFSDFSKNKKTRHGKMLFLSFPYGWCPCLSPKSVRTEARSYADVMTKFSRLDELTIFLTHSASPARFARGSSARKFFLLPRQWGLGLGFGSFFFFHVQSQIALWSLTRMRHLCMRTAHGIYRSCRREKLARITSFLGRWNLFQTNTPFTVDQR